MNKKLRSEEKSEAGTRLLFFLSQIQSNHQHKHQHHITSSEIIKKLGSSVAWVTSLKSQGHFQQVSDKVTAKYLYLYSPVFFVFSCPAHIIGLHLAYIVPPPDCLPYFPRDEGVCTRSTFTAPSAEFATPVPLHLQTLASLPGNIHFPPLGNRVLLEIIP